MYKCMVKIYNLLNCIWQTHATVDLCVSVFSTDMHSSCLGVRQDALCLSMAFLERFVNPNTRIDTIVEKQSTDISNRHIVCLFVIVEGIKVCGMQCLPLRGHRNDNTAECFTNQGNIFAILEYESDPVIKEHIEKGKKSEKYASKSYEIIHVIALCLREKVLKPLKKSNIAT